MTLTSATARRTFLEPAMDARALNDRQARLLSNTETPEIDSLTELLAAIGSDLRGTRSAPHLIRLWDFALEIRDSNGSEGAIQRTLCGSSEQFVSDLRNLELSGSGGSPLAAKALVRALREPLRVIADPPIGDPRALVDAGRTVGEIIARTPAGQLFSPAVARELGKTKAAALGELYERRETKGAATRAKGHGANQDEETARARSDSE